ncbi:glycosyltransferase [Polaribacter sp. MSW13]|uniref:Glycosyltransferase n=1 Tax=Polaribacter marinus TaxID=2916838 RepID=A0A9X1VPQ2_9FLAO|nr:glycosyltransferase [Polaribacter marinus]MCI2228385.1 glycosyltransferase [Polaribacter marinus]
MNNPIISIILPVYNGEKYLSQSIESCLNQTYKNIELIIVNDCSTDTSLAIAEKYQKKDNRIKIINNTANKKLPASLNIGHKTAVGDFFTWTSDDNLYLPNAIELMFNCIVDQKVDFVYADFIQINDEGKELRVFKLEQPEELIWRNVVGACFMYSKKVYVENKGYNESLFMVEDYDFWLRGFMEFKFYHINEVVYKYRIHQDSLTNEINDNNSEKSIIFEKNKLKMYLDIFEKYNYPIVLREMIIELQKKNIVFYKKIIKNRKEIQFFYKKHFRDSYKKHLFCLKNKYIKGVRQESKNQGVYSFFIMILLFRNVMTLNDYKTSLKVLTHNILNK